MFAEKPDSPTTEKRSKTKISSPQKDQKKEHTQG
jgi:hypothetical protein